MDSKRFRIRLKSPWRGEIDGKPVFVNAGDTVDVPADYVRGLVFQRQIAVLVSVDEILAQEAKVRCDENEENLPTIPLRSRPYGRERESSEATDKE